MADSHCQNNFGNTAGNDPWLDVGLRYDYVYCVMFIVRNIGVEGEGGLPLTCPPKIRENIFRAIIM